MGSSLQSVSPPPPRSALATSARDRIARVSAPFTAAILSFIRTPASCAGPLVFVGEELDNRGVAVRRDVDLETHADVPRRLRRLRRRRDGWRRRAREMDRRRGDDGRERGGGGGASGGGASGGEIVVEIGAGADED